MCRFTSPDCWLTPVALCAGSTHAACRSANAPSPVSNGAFHLRPQPCPGLALLPVATSFCLSASQALYLLGDGLVWGSSPLPPFLGWAGIAESSLWKRECLSPDPCYPPAPAGGWDRLRSTSEAASLVRPGSLGTPCWLEEETWGGWVEHLRAR